MREDRDPLLAAEQEAPPTGTVAVVVAVDAVDRVAAAAAGKATESYGKHTDDRKPEPDGPGFLFVASIKAAQ